jgi:SAM-dependent methyltransferase
VYDLDGVIVRGLSEAGEEDFAAVEASEFFRGAQADGALVGTRRVELSELPALEGQGWASALVHDRVPVVSYPYEWSFSMLQDAALLQLDLVRRCVADGFACKDGTPYNVQFVGARPTFIDVGSFEPLRGEPWPGYRQFCSLFLYPLLVEAHLDVSFAPFLRGSLEGIAPEEAAKLLRGRARLHRGILSHVTVQAMAARRYEARVDAAADLVQASGTKVPIVEALTQRMTKLVRGLQTPSSPTEWSDYSDRSHYSAASLTEKDRFVIEVLREARPAVVADLGCNDGRYAEMAAEHAQLVVALDADRRVVDALYRSLRERSLPILPLVGDLADPSPGLGWNLTERVPLAQRLAPDLVLSLALIHHLVIGRNVPVADYLDALAAMAPRTVLEVPHRDDPMVARLLAPKPTDTHADYHLRTIEALIEERFEVQRVRHLPGGTRTIFDLVARRA